MSLHAEVARWQLGHLLAGDEGSSQVRRAEAWMQAEGIRNPRAMARTFVPVGT